MVKGIVGFLVGVVLTCLVLWHFDTIAPQQFGGVAQPEDEELALSRIPDGSSNSERPALDQRDSPEASSGSIRLTGDSVPPEEADMRSRLSEAAHALDEARRVYIETQAEALRFEIARLRAMPVSTPISLPAEFAWLDDQSSEYSLAHELIQRESRDEAWASQAEAELNDFLFDNREEIQNYGPPEITCAETMCEVSMLAYQAPESDNRMTFNYFQQEFWQDPRVRARFDINASAGGQLHYENGVATLIFSFESAGEDGETRSTFDNIFR